MFEVLNDMRGSNLPMASARRSADEGEPGRLNCMIVQREQVIARGLV
jgi:hypothetical protein